MTAARNAHSFDGDRRDSTKRNWHLVSSGEPEAPPRVPSRLRSCTLCSLSFFYLELDLLRRSQRAA